MTSVKSSFGLRGIAVALLAVTALPLLHDWFSQNHANTPPSQSEVAQISRWIVPNRIEVELKPGENSGELSSLSRLIGTPLQWRSPLHSETEIATATLPPTASVQKALRLLRADPHVQDAGRMHILTIPSSSVLPSELVGPDHDTLPPAASGSLWKPNDPRYNEQWNFSMVHAEDAWGIARGKGVTVAVIDTGVAYANTRKGIQCKDFKQTHFVKGYDFIARDALPSDDNGHGTHVSGTIAESTNNNEGVAGLAFDAAIMPLKALSGAGGGTSAGIAEAIRYAADHGANVINMSLGSPFPDRLIRDACAYAHRKGVTIVCAAGNNASDHVGYPAAYPDCIAVSAVGPKGELSFYSNWGKAICVAAPGGDTKAGDGPAGAILQNTLSGADGALEDGYYGFQGTSMASPHVAAVAALIESCGIHDPDDVRCILLKSAQAKAPASKYGAGIVDAGKAVKLAANTYQDGVARFWIAAFLFAGCLVIGQLRKRAGNSEGYPFWTAAALAAGLLVPDWLAGFAGLGAHINIIAHSVLIPFALLLFGVEGPRERRLLGWFAFSLSLNLGWEWLRGTIPPGLDYSQWLLLPWVASNMLIGAGLFLSGIFTPQD